MQKHRFVYFKNLYNMADATLFLQYVHDFDYFSQS